MAIATLLAVVVLAVSVLAACHALHEFLHSTGDANHHQCLVCSFAKGQADAPAVAACSLVVLLACLGFWPLFQERLNASFAYRLSPSRAPPRR